MNVGTVVEFLQKFLNTATESVAANSGAPYGGGMAGAKFDPISFIKKPQVILRIINLIFSLLVFWNIISVNDDDNGSCPLNKDQGACSFSTTVGVFAFLICIFFLLIDARFDNFSNINTRKRAVIIDMGLSGVYAFIWFVTFCYLADAWRKTDDQIAQKVDSSSIRTAIAFSFLSIITWALTCFLNFLRYRQGISTIFNGEYEDHTENNLQQQPNMNRLNNETFTPRQVPFNPVMNNPNNGYQQQPTY